MTSTIRRTTRQFLCCLVIVSMIAATSLTPRPTRADGGTGGDPLATAVVATIVVISLLPTAQMPFLRGFLRASGPVLVSLLIVDLVTRAAMLNLLAIRQRRTPLLAQLLQTTLLFTVAVYAVTLTQRLAQLRTLTMVQLWALGLGPLFHSPMLSVQRQKPTATKTIEEKNEAFLDALTGKFDVVRYGEGPTGRPVYRNLFKDAQAGDPTAQAIVALLPRYHSRGFLPLGILLGPVGVAAGQTGLAVMELPGMYLSANGPV